MLKKKRGLGSLGVDVLLSAAKTENAISSSDASSDKSLQSLPIDLIHQSPYQPRQVMEPEALEELARSIRQQGVVQPIVVRKAGDEYELIAGERRWRASQQAGLQNIPAVVKNVNDQEAAAIAIIENLQREDLNPLEEAQAFANLIEKFGLTHQEVGEVVSRSRAAVSNSLRLLALAQPVKDMLNQGELEMGHARPLLALSEQQQIKCAQNIVQRHLSVRGAEALVKQLQEGGSKKKSTTSIHQDPDISRMEHKLADRLGARVSIQHSQNGSGRMQIRYTNLDEFEGIIEKLLGKSK
ncbi:MAG: ParB/RepB/Spo0J family partition protein [Gammaproteobacteria bacterium]|nr:ParB/RepB/Spo0J family partition protein [Gammaproteobacteria bacterium]NNC66954.1 ParB/RepB/Spo0J family partition protein [Gammaproteobacteria bacterium]